MNLLFVLLVAFALQGCSFITTAAGSFVGNLGADLVEDRIKQEQIKKMLEEDAMREFKLKDNVLIKLSIPF